MRTLLLLADNQPVALNELTKEEIDAIYALYKNAVDVFKRKEIIKFYVGQSVWFISRKGYRVDGEVIKVNTKSVKIKSEDHGVWNVSSSLLKITE